MWKEKAEEAEQGSQRVLELSERLEFFRQTQGYLESLPLEIKT